MSALLNIARTARAKDPLYYIPTNRPTTAPQFVAARSPIVQTEGILATQHVGRCRRAAIIHDALCLWRPRAQTFWFRLLRDLGEARKPPMTLLRRGLSLLRQEPSMVAELESRGARKIRVADAEQ